MRLEKSLDRFFRTSWSVDTPFLSHDKLLFGEIVSFVRLEGGWCRGYVLFEAREEALWRLLQSGAIPGTESGRNQDADFRRTNSLLTEISNLSWGRLKSWFERQDIADEPERFFGQSFPALSIMNVVISALEAMMQSSALPISVWTHR